MKEKPTAAAAKRRLSSGTTPRKRPRDGSYGCDLISDLPNDILGIIVSLLPTKDGARTQAVARRCNLDAGNIDTRYPPHRQGPRPPTRSIISRILSDHQGPVRRFDFRLPSIRKRKWRYNEEVAHVESWLRSGRLDNLHELHICVESLPCFHCDFPDEMAPSLSFPLLKHLTLMRVSISEDVFDAVLSACHVLETLLFEENRCIAPLHISSPTLRSIGFRNFYMGEAELVIEDTPRLERLLLINSSVETIRIIWAPKLEILGPLSPRNSNIQIGELIVQGLIPTSLDHSICTVKILALQFSYTDLHPVVDILGFFPCLEKLYVTRDKFVAVKMKNVCHYDPPDPIKCLETHLTNLVLKNYIGDKHDVSFVKFFVSNAKVLKEIKFGVSGKIDKKWVANQHGLLGVETKASPDAQFEFIRVSSFKVQLDTHDLSIADPFDSLIRRRG
ncbi:unnamed protein product [Alopecurus aequalis]